MKKSHLWAVAALVAAAAFLAGLTGAWDPDLFHHLAVGRALARGTSFATEPFLYPLAGRPAGVPAYWLGSLALYAASLPAGVPGTVVLAALAGAALFAILFVDAAATREREAGPGRALLAAGLLALALPELRLRSAPRPELFGAFLVAFTLLAIRRFESGRPRALHAFPAVAFLWTQLHVTVVMGVGLVALLAASEAVRAVLLARAPAPAPAGRARAAALVLAAGCLAAALNPSPTGPATLAWRFLAATAGGGDATGAGGANDPAGLGAAVRLVRQHILELHAPSFQDWASRPFGWLVAIALASFLLHRPRAWLREVATLLAFAAFAATAFRFTSLAAFVAAPIAARNLGAWWEARRARRPRLALAAAALAAAAGVIGASTSPAWGAYPVGVALQPGAFPVRAAAYLRAIGFDGRLYNEFDEGGYFQWALDRPVYQDGRALVPPADVAEILPEPVDPARMARLDARHHFDALAIAAAIPANADPELLEQLHGGRDPLADRATWSLVAVDDRAALYLRRDGRLAGAAARDEYRYLAPGTPTSTARFAEPGYVEGLLGDLERAAREAPGCVRCRLDLARVLLELGRAAEVARPLAEARAIGAREPRAEIELLDGAAAERSGDTARAEARYRAAGDAARAVGADPRSPRRALAALLVRRGRGDEARALVQANLDATPAAGRAEGDLVLALELARRAGDEARVGALGRELEVVRRAGFAHARANDGVALVRSGRAAEALAAFREALAADGGDAATRTHLGLLLLDSGDARAAADELGRAVALDPSIAEAWFGLGVARQAVGDRAGAGEAFRRLLRLQDVGRLADQARSRLAALAP